MSKNAKKIKVLQARVIAIEKEMAEALKLKGKGQAYDVPAARKKITDLTADIKRLM